MNEVNIERKLIEFMSRSKGYEYCADIKDKNSFRKNLTKQLTKLNGFDITESDILDIERYLFDSKNGNYAYSFNERMFNSIKLNNRDKNDKNNKARIISRSMSENTFQIINQYRDSDNAASRYDVTLLVNGIPFVQIELKRQDIEIEEAINQINRYIRNAFSGWFKLVQIFVVSNETNTRYGSNSNTKLNKAFMFRWSDEENNIIDNLYKFADTFLGKECLFDVITQYTVRKQGNGNETLIVMRPYQIYAIKAVMSKVKRVFNSVDRIKNNGYIFHTTGSGKTLTSFKCMQLISKLDTVDKVIFLVDRQDLDAQTTIEFKSFDGGCDIDGTDNTEELLRKFNSKSHRAIITTIQKMSIAINKVGNDADYERILGEYRDKNIVFIIDECHRTQFGAMHNRITNYFTKSRYIGFTGTPIYTENMGSNNKTTKSLFNEELHSYRIDSAIKDKNVLGFSVDYHNTVMLSSEYYNIEEQDKSDSNKVNAIEVIEHPDRIKMIVDKVFEIHNKKTINRKYTAIFAVQSVSSLVKYYEEFKRHNLSLPVEDRLRVSAIFTSSDDDIKLDETVDLNANTNNSINSITYKDKLNEIISDFNTAFKIKCTDDVSFRSELTKRLKCIGEPSIDIVIVVNIFLTGFDSKRTNTLYVDKNLVYHGLLQAFSRTNRVESEVKSFGNIVCFRPLKKNVDDAIKLFNKCSDSNTIIAKSFDNCYKTLLNIIDEVIEVVPSDFSMANATETEKVEFVKRVRKLNHALNETKQFAEFNWDKIADKLNQDDYNRIIGQYKQLKSDTEGQEKESLLDYIDFCMELVESDKIDLDYISNLIYNIDLSTVATTQVYVDNIKNILNKSTSDALLPKKELINRFLDKLIQDRGKESITSTSNVQSEFRKFVQNEKRIDIAKQSLDSGVSKDNIDKIITKLEVTGKLNSEEVSSKIKEAAPTMGLIKRRSLEKTFKNWMVNTVRKFKDLF